VNTISRLACLGFTFAATVLSPLRGSAQAPAPVGSVGAPPAPELTTADVSAWLDGLVPFALKEHGLAAAVVVVVKDGAVLAASGFGYADVAAGTPVDPARTLFRPGSIAKTMTWTAVMQLVEQGKLDLDADVNVYLDFPIPAREGRPITLRNLMTHTPGFEDVAKNLFVTDPRRIDNAAWLKADLPQRVFPPGEISAYSNYGAALAGYIVERVSGERFDQYMERHVLTPLDMQRSTFQQPLPAVLAPDMAQSYFIVNAPPQPFELVGAPPAGSLSATGIDMAHYMIAHLADGRFGDARILAPATAQQMHNAEFRSIPGLMPIALGFPRMDRNGHRVIGHTGETQFFHSLMLLFIDDHVGVFLSVDGATDGGLVRRMMTGFADRYFPAALSRRPSLPSAQADGALLVGRYATTRAPATTFLSAINLFSQQEIVMLGDATLLTTAFRDLSDAPRRWREVEPFLWEDVADPQSRLGAVIEHGRVLRMSAGNAAAAVNFLPVPAAQSAAWNLPLLYFAFATVLATSLAWPIGAWRRRRLRAAGAVVVRPRFYSASRCVAALHLLFALGWFYVFALASGSNAALGSDLDATLRGVQLIGVLAICGIVAVGAYVRAVWVSSAGLFWPKVRSALLLLACLATVWFCWSLHLLTPRLNF